VLYNLLSNAVKFTNEGIIEIGYNKKKDFVVFYIKDTGIGISKDNISKIFERFKQVDEGFSRRYGGTGLGLSISKALVEMMGGEIWVESEFGQGSTFYFSLPIKNA
jgi:signal transduction histidine kinase